MRQLATDRVIDLLGSRKGQYELSALLREACAYKKPEDRFIGLAGALRDPNKSGAERYVEASLILHRNSLCLLPIIKKVFDRPPPPYRFDRLAEAILGLVAGCIWLDENVKPGGKWERAAPKLVAHLLALYIQHAVACNENHELKRLLTMDPLSSNFLHQLENVVARYLYVQQHTDDLIVWGDIRRIRTRRQLYRSKLILTNLIEKKTIEVTDSELMLVITTFTHHILNCLSVSDQILALRRQFRSRNKTDS